MRIWTITAIRWHTPTPTVLQGLSRVRRTVQETSYTRERIGLARRDFKSLVGDWQTNDPAMPIAHENA